MNPSRTPLLVLAASLLIACSSRSANLKPYRDQSPQALIAEVDHHVYSPVTAGLKRATADLVVDISGFYPKAKRPAEPVWVSVKFSWDNGKATFTTSELPGKAAELEKQLLEVLKGKEEDIINRPFSQRLEGDRLVLSEAENGNLVVTAIPKESKINAWKLFIDPEFRVPRIEVTTATSQIHSDLEYDNNIPAKIRNIVTQYVDSGQTTRVTVDFSYQNIGRFQVPSKVVYTTKVGQLEFPPLTIGIRNFKANP